MSARLCRIRGVSCLFGWLNETNQMNQINQINQTDQSLLGFCPESPHLYLSTCPRV